MALFRSVQLQRASQATPNGTAPDEPLPPWSGLKPQSPVSVLTAAVGKLPSGPLHAEHRILIIVVSVLGFWLLIALCVFACKCCAIRQNRQLFSASLMSSPRRLSADTLFGSDEPLARSYGSFPYDDVDDEDSDDWATMPNSDGEDAETGRQGAPRVIWRMKRIVKVLLNRRTRPSGPTAPLVGASPPRSSPRGSVTPLIMITDTERNQTQIYDCDDDDDDGNDDDLW